MGDKSKQDAFKTAFKGFGAKPPSAGPAPPGGARDNSPAGASDGSAQQAGRVPLSKQEEEAQRKKDNVFITPGHS